MGILAMVLSGDVEYPCEFRRSDELTDRSRPNIHWGQRGHFVGIGADLASDPGVRVVVR